MATRKNIYEDDDAELCENYYSSLAGDMSVVDKCARNKRNTKTCYSSKHVRVSQASKATRVTSKVAKTNK